MLDHVKRKMLCDYYQGGVWEELANQAFDNYIRSHKGNLDAQKELAQAQEATEEMWKKHRKNEWDRIYDNTKTKK